MPAKRLGHLARAVAQRSLGIERFMVLRVQKESGYEISFMVEDVTLVAFREMAWYLEGPALRKDSTIGVRRTQISFRQARIWRRTLEGDWVAVRPKAHLWTNPHAHSD